MFEQDLVKSAFLDKYFSKFLWRPGYNYVRKCSACIGSDKVSILLVEEV